MSVRKSVPKSVRFEVFKRDSFTCQYCGGKAPDVLLHLEHIQPVSKGGDNDLLNLVTSCQACNLGKGSRELSDASAIEKARRQVEELQKRREQIEMVMRWQQSLADMNNQEVDACVAVWLTIAPGKPPNNLGRCKLKLWIKKFGIGEVIEAMNAAAKYVIIRDGKATDESFEVAFSKIGGICAIRDSERKDPLLAEAWHLRNIFNATMRFRGRNLSHSDLRFALDKIKEALEAGRTFQEIKSALNGITSIRDINILFK
jgi:hypothetical protein